ncbi:hypothetical protein OG589_42650 [Sphaerisporangium sp. NBC_01403]|uniref:hypothetical protein n=1 Tax=Sphaerisporangium sp. NBC_01403 TaxID=2903599 RepID=UPI0032488CC1
MAWTFRCQETADAEAGQLKGMVMPLLPSGSISSVDEVKDCGEWGVKGVGVEIYVRAEFSAASILDRIHAAGWTPLGSRDEADSSGHRVCWNCVDGASKSVNGRRVFVTVNEAVTKSKEVHRWVHVEYEMR